MMTTPHDHPSARTRASGFLGRGPLFWLGLTLAGMGALAGLALSEAIANEAVLLLLAIVPALTMFATFRAMFNAGPSPDASCAHNGAAQRRYTKRVALFTSLYLATFAGRSLLDDGHTIPVAAHYAIAILPGLAIIGGFWAIGRLIVEESDEFLRMLTVRQTLIASALAISAATIWGFLESADLVPHIDAYWFAAVWFVGLFVGALINRIEHGTWGAA